MYAKKLLAAKYAAVFVLGIFVAWFAWGRGDSVPGDDSARATVEAKTAEGPTTWTCSMHPQIRLPKPGKCPICRMDLIPVTKTSGGMRTLTVSPAAKALMNVETAPVERRYVTHTIPMVGKIDYDETKLGYITAWFPGRLDRLYIDYTGVEVKKGDRILIGKYSGTEVKIDGEEHMILNEDDVLGIIEK